MPASYSTLRLFVGHGVDGRNEPGSRLFPKRNDRIVRLDIPVKNTVFDTVDPGLKQFLHVIVIESMGRCEKTVFLALADDLLHQRLIDFPDRLLLVEIPVVSALIGEFQKVNARLLQLPDPCAYLLGGGYLNGHLRPCPGAVGTKGAGGVPAGSCKVRADKQQLRPGYLA